MSCTFPTPRKWGPSQLAGRSSFGAAGPVDGPAIFDKVKGCHISVAAQQLQVRGSTDSEFAVYSANKPTIEHSTGVPAF